MTMSSRFDLSPLAALIDRLSDEEVDDLLSRLVDGSRAEIALVLIPIATLGAPDGAGER